MTKRSVLLVMALGVSISACQPAGELSEMDKAAIMDLADSFDQAVQANDWTAYAALFAEDAVVMPPNQPAVEGREAIEDFGSAFTIREFSTPTVEIEGRDGLAYMRGTYSISATVEGIPEPVTDSGKYVQIWMEQPDGSWKIWRDIWNSDMPVPSTQ